ncbi:hypothetical protein FD755_020009, partial [Muntiacus reevesi]
FRLHNDRVYFVNEMILKLAASISNDTAAPYAKYKVWIKPGAEHSLLFGNLVVNSGLGGITENTSQFQEVLVYSMADIPLDCRKVDPMAIVVVHLADIGEYVWHEETLNLNEIILRMYGCVEGPGFVSFVCGLCHHVEFCRHSDLFRDFLV